MKRFFENFLPVWFDGFGKGAILFELILIIWGISLNDESTPWMIWTPVITFSLRTIFFLLHTLKTMKKEDETLRNKKG